MPFENAVIGLLSFNPSTVYPNCQYSLLHKIIQDGTHSSTNKWRYTHVSFFWSWEAIHSLANLAGTTINQALPPPAVTLEFPNLPAPAPTPKALLHQEHVVPTGLAIQHLLGLITPNRAVVTNVLDKALLVCIVTKAENKRIFKTRMPPQQPDFMLDKWARYRYPKTGSLIEISPYFCYKWQGSQVEFRIRQPIDMIGAPGTQQLMGECLIDALHVAKAMSNDKTTNDTAKTK